jgi:hypothetical protein
MQIYIYIYICLNMYTCEYTNNAFLIIYNVCICIYIYICVCNMCIDDKYQWAYWSKCVHYSCMDDDFIIYYAYTNPCSPLQFLLFLYMYISLVHVVMSWRKSLSWLGCICTVCMYNESADKEANKIISLFKFSYACINTAWYYHDAIKHNSSKKLTYSILLWSTTEILIWLFMC